MENMTLSNGKAVTNGSRKRWMAPVVSVARMQDAKGAAMPPAFDSVYSSTDGTPLYS